MTNAMKVVRVNHRHSQKSDIDRNSVSLIPENFPEGLLVRFT